MGVSAARLGQAAASDLSRRAMPRPSAAATTCDAADGPRWRFGDLAVRPGASIAATEIPPISVGDTDPIDLPDQDGGAPEPSAPDQAAPGPAAPAPAGNGCGQPLSMGKIVAGGFLGGLTMDDYFPDLRGRGFWRHPGSGGPFDTGRRVGGTVQLFGVIPSYCDPSQFTLAQTVTRTRTRINGIPDLEEGQTSDDIAKSRRNPAVAPFRQEFTGGGGAPAGYIISMADLPGIEHREGYQAEYDRDFVTSLKGPAGQRSVSWSLSIRVEKGVVTRNTLT